MFYHCTLLTLEQAYFFFLKIYLLSKLSCLYINSGCQFIAKEGALIVCKLSLVACQGNETRNALNVTRNVC